MKYIKLIALFGLFSILITSCSKKSDLGKMIPKEAGLIVHLNTKSILSKLPWEEIKQSYWYNRLMSDTSISSSSKAFISDPEKTGIDIKSDILFFVLKPDNNGQAVVRGTLNDSKAFSEFIKKMHPRGTATKDGDITMFKTEDAVIGWDDKRFAFVGGADASTFQNIDSLNIDSISAPVKTLPLPASVTDSLVKVCKNLFNLKDDNSLYKNENFAKLVDEEGDMHFWINSTELSRSSMQGMSGMAGMVKLDKFLENNISTATVNFEDGKITGTTRQYFGKELSDILKKGEGDLNTDMIKRLPSQNIAAVYAMHFTPASLLEIIKLTGLDGFMNLFLGAEGLSLDDIVKATKGDIVFAVSDITLKDDTTNLQGMSGDSIMNPGKKPGATFFFSVAIADKDAFNKLLNFGKKMGKDVTQVNAFQKTDDKYFALSNSQDAINKYFSGTQSNPAFLSKINDHPMGGFVDVQMILKALQPQLTKDSSGQVLYNTNIAMWNTIYFTGGEYKNGSLVGNGEINLMDTKTNSLKQLNKYVDETVKVMVEKKKKQKLEWGKDSTANMLHDSLRVQK